MNRFSPAARSRLIAIASSRAMMLRSCVMLTSTCQIQICPRGLGSRAVAAPMPMTMVARSSTLRNQPRRASIVAAAWQGAANDADDSSGTDQSPVGRIEIITGPMFSGKSTELLRRAAEHEAAGRRVALVSSSKDTRYGVSSVVTHAGVARRCISVSRLSDLRAAIEKAATATATAATAAPPPTLPPPLLPSLDSYDVIAIDEAQFFDDLVPFATAMADGRGFKEEKMPLPSPLSRSSPPSSPSSERALTLLVAGLDGDSTRSPFGGVLQLVPHAEEVTRLAARCAFCGADAHFSVQVGGAESYAPACRRHYLHHISNSSSSSESSSSKVLVERQ